MDITHAGLNNVDFARNTMLQHKIKQIVNGQHFEIRKFYLMTVSIIAHCVYLCALASDLGSSKVLFDTRSPGHPQKPATIGTAIHPSRWANRIAGRAFLLHNDNEARCGTPPPTSSFPHPRTAQFLMSLAARRLTP